MVVDSYGGWGSEVSVQLSHGLPPPSANCGGVSISRTSVCASVYVMLIHPPTFVCCCNTSTLNNTICFSPDHSKTRPAHPRSVQ